MYRRTDSDHKLWDQLAKLKILDPELEEQASYTIDWVLYDVQWQGPLETLWTDQFLESTEKSRKTDKYNVESVSYALGDGLFQGQAWKHRNYSVFRIGISKGDPHAKHYEVKHMWCKGGVPSSV